MFRGRVKRRACRPLVEALDQRCLLSAAGLTPAQLTAAYGLGGLSFNGRIDNGSGQTIALVDAYNDPNLEAELTTFDASNNLPAPPSLSVLGESGTTALPGTDAGWAQEEALDVEWAHAIAPGAGLVLVEASSTRLSDFMTAVKTAASLPGVSVVSMSWGGAETSRAVSYDPDFTVSGVTFVAASGDDGPGSGAQWPASSPSVVGVGGTTLEVSATGTYEGETAWSGTSGGASTIEVEPSFQLAVQSSGRRSTPDVAFDADINTGVQVYSIDPFNGQGSWLVVGGTSLGAPAWAGVIALADQGRAVNQMTALGSSETLDALYGLPASDFHVINGGFNTQTGLGTPDGAALVKGLVSYSAATTTPPVTSPPITNPPVTTPPANDVPIITLPVLTGPGNTAPVTTVPVSTEPVVSPPTNSPSQPVAQTGLTPPPAPSPVSPVHKSTKKNTKHVVSHPKPVVHHVKAHTARLRSLELGKRS